MSLAEGNLRQAIRDETRMVLGQEFSVSASTSNTLTVFDIAKQKPVYMTSSSANVFVGCLVLFTSGQNAGAYYLVTGALSRFVNGAGQPLILTMDQPFALTVEEGDTFQIYTVPPAYNGQSNVPVGPPSVLNFPADSTSIDPQYGNIEPGVFSTPGSLYVLQFQWDTEGPLSILLQNANGWNSQSVVTGFADLAKLVLPGSPGQQLLSKSFTVRGACTGPANSGYLDGSLTFMNIAATPILPTGPNPSTLTVAAFAI